MNSDGTGRTKVADQRPRAVLEPRRHPDRLYEGRIREVHATPTAATKGLFIYDLKTGKTREHVNNKLRHLYTLNWSPDGKWFVATVHGGLGFAHTILAIEADGDKIFDLKLAGCRPNISPDGKKLCWGHGDYLCRRRRSRPVRVDARRRPTSVDVVAEQVPDRNLSYHLVAGHEIPRLHAGPKLKGRNLKGLLPEFPGVEAPGWNVCVADWTQKESLGRHHQRWQIVQTTELGRGQGGRGQMMSRKNRIVACVITAAS